MPIPITAEDRAALLAQASPFIPMDRPGRRSPEWKRFGLPGATKSYEAHSLGMLSLIKSPTGIVGVSGFEAVRFYIENSRPLDKAKRDRSRATAASVAARKAGRPVA